MKDVHLVVFDMAGTTVRDDGQVPRAFAAALARHGVALTDEQIAAVRGSSKREAVRQFVPAGPNHARVAGAIYTSFRQELEREFNECGVRSVSGAAALFEWLRHNGTRVALNTGFDRDVTRLLVAALGWERHVVDAVVCADDVPQGRPAPDLILEAMRVTKVVAPAGVANVGDTALDLEAGHNARVRWNIGVLTGAHDRARLSRAPHTHIVESIVDLPRLFAAGVTLPTDER
jgi:phosphonatase-like hydrolase